jgi:nitrate reductase gamma subunit
MAEDFDHKNVALVAGIIGGVVLLIGLVGVLITLL